MTECEMVGRCLFFQGTLLRMPRLAARMKETYCHGDKLSCGRHLVIESIDLDAINADPVLKDRLTYVLRTLFPNDMNAARKFIESLPCDVLHSSDPCH